MRSKESFAAIGATHVSLYVVPTDAPEADGTLAWNKTTMVLVEMEAAGRKGLGYTYADAGTARLVEHLLKTEVHGKDVFSHSAIHAAMARQVRNLGGEGMAAMAISAIDWALWDLHARLLEVSLVNLLGRARDRVQAYGSGGFTAYDREQLQSQLSGWAEQGFSLVKMKIGNGVDRDFERVREARRAIGEGVGLMVDANGAYTAKQALAVADRISECGVVWFEEPTSSDNLLGLEMVRHESPRTMEIAAGEYGYTSWYFKGMLEAGSVDVLQADGTRCFGLTGFLEAASLANGFEYPLSAHCAPSLHMHAMCAIPRARHVEYFHDHVRIESMFFEGFLAAKDGYLTPDVSAPGLGLNFRHGDAKRYRVPL